MKVGVLGGTFDPIHFGHLVAAEEVRCRLTLAKVIFVPAGHPPHKQGRPIAAAEHRFAMVELAIAANSHFFASRVEVDRAGLSYTVDTVAELMRTLGGRVDLHFIIGIDSLADLLTWHKPAQLVRICRIVAVSRPGYSSYDLTELERTIPEARQRITIVEVPHLDIASSDLRARVALGEPIEYQVPGSVKRYIENNGLYRS